MRLAVWLILAALVVMLALGALETHRGGKEDDE